MRANLFERACYITKYCILQFLELLLFARNLSSCALFMPFRRTIGDCGPDYRCVYLPSLGKRSTPQPNKIKTLVENAWSYRGLRINASNRLNTTTTSTFLMVWCRRIRRRKEISRRIYKVASSLLAWYQTVYLLYLVATPDKTLRN
jgi:hypothetical protein